MTQRNLVTPCHGEPLTIYTRDEGRAYMSYEVVDEIICSAKGCHNYWNPDGTVGYWNEEEG